MSARAPLPQPRRRGRPPCCSRELALRIIGLERRGLAYGQIAAVLNADGVPTPMGRALWRKSYVDRVLHTRYVRELKEELAAVAILRLRRTTPIQLAIKQGATAYP